MLSVLTLAVIGRGIISIAFPYVLRKVAAAYDLDASYSRMELYLLDGDVGLWNLTVRPKAGGPPLMTTEYVRVSVSALNLLRGKLVVQRAELDRMELDVEREADGRIPALEKLLAGGEETPRTDDQARELSFDPPLRVDALRINRLRAHWVDRSVSPVIDTELELTLWLSEVGVADRPVRVLIEGSSPPLLESLRSEGTVTAQRKRLDANLDVVVRGLHPKPAAGYLAQMGIKAIGDSIALRAATEIRIRVADSQNAGVKAALPSGHVAGTVMVKNMSVTVDGREAAGVDSMVVGIDALSVAGAALSNVTIDGVRVNASRTAEGRLRFVGLELAPSGPSTAPAAPAVAASPTATTGAATTQPHAAAALTLKQLTIRNLRAAFRDGAITPVANLAFVIDQLELAGIDSAQPDTPVGIAGTFSSPRVVNSIDLKGTMQPFAATRTLDAKLVAQGIRPDAIRGYLDAAGIESTLADGALTCDLRAAVAVLPDGAVRADARLANVRLADAAAGELLALATVDVSGLSLDSTGSHVRVEAVDVTGPRLSARREADGTIVAAGIRMGRPAPARLPVPAIAPGVAMAASGTAAPPAGSSSQPAAFSPYRFELGRLTWKDVEVQFVDQAVAPATTVRMSKAGVELANIVVDLDPRAGATAPGEVRAWIAAPGVADRLQIEGSVTPNAGAVTADLKITGQGLRGDLIAPYLKGAGIEPALRNGSLQLRTRVAVSQKGKDAIAASLAVDMLRYTDGDQELLGLDRLLIDNVAVTPRDVAVTSVQMDKPRALVRRNADGSLTMAGFRFNAPTTQPSAAILPTPAAGSPSPVRPPLSAAAPAPFVATLDKLRVNDGSFAWADQAVTPAVNAVAHANIEVDRFVFGRDAAPALVKIVANLDQTLGHFSAAGTVTTSTTSPAVRLDVAGSGLREGVLGPYLPPGMNVALKDGRFRATLEAGVTPHPQGGQTAKLIVSAVDYRDGEATEPLLSFDSARLLVSRADVPGEIIAIDEVSLAGLRTGARKASDGSLHTLGLTFPSAAQVPAQPPPAPAARASASRPAHPGPATDREAILPARRKRLPLITLKTLAVNLSRVWFLDESKLQTVPITLADVALRNKGPVELFGDDPQSRPPVDLDLVGKIAPVVGEFTVATQIAPFASQPTLQVAVTASGINGSGLTDVLPELWEYIDGSELTNGRFAASIEVIAKFARRGPAEWDFSKPMELAAVVRDVAFRADSSESSPVLAGVHEVRADGVRFDPATGSVIARSVEVLRPVARVWRDAEAIRALGVAIKTPPSRLPVGAPKPKPKPPGPRGPNFVTPYGKPIEAKVAPPKPPAEMTIERLIVSGIDVNVEDRSIKPPLMIPLNSLEADIHGLSNMVMREPRPVRFNITAGAAKLPAAPGQPPRAMFSEIVASGKLTLFPSPRGSVRSTVSGLEVISLKGPATAAKVTISDGVFDGHADLRFQDDGSLDVRSRFAFTDLRMSEPDNGFIRRVLKLPGPLDAMIILLEDDSGAITVPLNVTVRKGNVSSGQVAGAAVTALGSILATAVASAPLKLAGGAAEAVGLDQVLGGGKKPTGPQVAGAIDFFEGAGDTSSTSGITTLQELIRRMRRDKTLEVTLRHELGGGDIARAAQRANPSLDAAAAMGARLRQTKAALLLQREQLAPAARAMIIADPAGGAAEAIAKLREVEAQLAVTEEALDRVYDLTMPGADRQAQRRTRSASLEIAEARLEAMKQMIIAAGIPDAENRVRVIKPQFTPTGGDAGGKVTMVVISKKKP